MRLARLLGCGQSEARGYAASLWSWSLIHSPDKDLSKWDPIEIESPIGFFDPLGDPRVDRTPGRLIECMIEATLLDRIEDGGLRIHNPDRADSHRDRVRKAEKRRAERSLDRVSGKCPGQSADSPQNVPDSPRTVRAVFVRSDQIRSKEKRGRDRSDRSDPNLSPKKKPRRSKTPAPQSEVIAAWNANASGYVGKAGAGSRPQRDDRIAALRGKYPAAKDPEVWGWIARAMAADPHQGKSWPAKGRLLWLIKPANREHFERWLDAGLELRAKTESAERRREAQPELEEIGAAVVAMPRRSDEEFETLAAKAREIKGKLKI
jgi:hypothetical protein